MEKKLELTINKKIFFNLLISFILAVIIVFLLNYIDGGGTRSAPLFESKTFFGSSVYGHYYGFDFALEAIQKDAEVSVILFLTILSWSLIIINHFIKFKIK